MIKIFKVFIFCLSLISLLPLSAQQNSNYRKHLVYFKDKANSSFSTTNPSQYLSERALVRRQKQKIAISPRDFPVNLAYVAGLRSNGAEVLYTSKWFNAAVVYCDSVQLAQISTLPFVKSGQTLSRKVNSRNISTIPDTKPLLPASLLRTENDRQNYGLAYNQANMIGAVDLHKAGYSGEGMYVAIFDGGFPNVNQMPAFAHLFTENRLKATYDFVGRDPMVFERDNHGTNVLSTMAAFQPGTFIGTGYKANYFLFITEDSQGEQHIEEINWLLAAEFADSAGVDVINSSLGYNDFDAPGYDYTYQDMNGKTALITRAADYAAGTGMLIVNSAGNEGNSPWRYISAPADADSILTVGAVDSLGRLAAFSSIGPTADGRIKPNLVAQGIFAAILTKSNSLSRANGTSFSSPILAGMAACFWQANPQLTNMEVIQYLQQTANKATKPDSFFGYGIPNGHKAYEKTRSESNKIFLFPNPARGSHLKLKVGPKFWDQRITVTVFNMIAQKLFTQTFQNKIAIEPLELDITYLNPGMYSCIVTGDKTQEAFKFLRL